MASSFLRTAIVLVFLFNLGASLKFVDNIEISNSKETCLTVNQNVDPFPEFSYRYLLSYMGCAWVRIYKNQNDFQLCNDYGKRLCLAVVGDSEKFILNLEESDESQTKQLWYTFSDDQKDTIMLKSKTNEKLCLTDMLITWENNRPEMQPCDEYYSNQQRYKITNLGNSGESEGGSKDTYPYITIRKPNNHCLSNEKWFGPSVIFSKQYGNCGWNRLFIDDSSFQLCNENENLCLAVVTSQTKHNILQMVKNNKTNTNQQWLKLTFPDYEQTIMLESKTGEHLCMTSTNTTSGYDLPTMQPCDLNSFKQRYVIYPIG